MADEEKYQSLVELDADKLDEHWIDQPRLFMKYALKLADARADVDEAKANLELVRATAEVAIRADPAGHGVEKVTEKAIEAAVETSATYRNAVADLNDARRRMGRLDAVVQSLEHRKRALEGMVSLHGMGYFAEPTDRGGNGHELASKGAKDRAFKPKAGKP